MYWLSVSPGRWGWTQVRIPQQAFFQGWLLSVLLTSGALSDPVPINAIYRTLLLAYYICTFVTPLTTCILHICQIELQYWNYQCLHVKVHCPAQQILTVDRQWATHYIVLASSSDQTGQPLTLSTQDYTHNENVQGLCISGGYGMVTNITNAWQVTSKTAYSATPPCGHPWN